MWILWTVLAVVVLYIVFQWGASSGQGKIMYLLRIAEPDVIEEYVDVMRETLETEKWYKIPLLRPTLFYMEAYEWYFEQKMEKLKKEDS